MKSVYTRQDGVLAEPKYAHKNFISEWLIDGFFGAVEELLGLAGPGAALEVACGTGESTERIREMLPAEVPLEASDVDHELVAVARKRCPGLPIRCESIFQLERESRSVDIVIALEVLEHLEEPEQALRELCRVSGRWLLLSVPREPIWSGFNMARAKYLSSWGNTPGHVQRWSSSGFARMVRRHAKVHELRAPLPWTILLAEVRAEA